jgi:hypothetical protein
MKNQIRALNKARTWHDQERDIATFYEEFHEKQNNK